MPSQSHTHEVTSVAIFSWYIIGGAREWRFGLWRVSAERGDGMCRCVLSDNKWCTSGENGQVPLANKVSSCL
jgi:hypothetical protein